MQERDKILLFVGVSFAVFIILLILYPQYNVYSAGMNGKAAYQEAEQNRNIRILEATAQEEAALHNYNTTVINAKAHADAIKIIGAELERYPKYTTYMWIDQASATANKQFIYIPSGELGMPITEAVRLQNEVGGKQ